MKKIKLLVLLLVVQIARADEGMWLPQLLAQLNEAQMKKLGMKITAADIYSVNKGSLKDAIVSFGGFCTGEVISEKGLVLTNHHCGFDAIQNHSTLQNNYIKDGFWAMNTGQEIPNPGLFVTFIVSINDVTADALKGVTSGIPESERQSAIDKNLAALRTGYKRESYQDVQIRPFFEGNKYYLFVTETYRDVRLVGAPPSSIGNFGKDTDNWMWPRHTGDFSLFRIYAGPDNKPAAFSPNNIPYKPKRALSISLSGVQKNDFTMVFGFPGRTTQYLPSVAVEQIINMNDPAKIAIRERALQVIDQRMRKDEGIKIQYAAKYASIQNAYKKWQGEVLGMQKTAGLEEKRAYEAQFTKRVNANPSLKTKYGDLLPQLNEAYAAFAPYSYSRDYYTEVVGRIEAFTVASRLMTLKNALEKNGEAGLKAALPATIEALEDFYKEYNPAVDKEVFASLMDILVNNQKTELTYIPLQGKDMKALADEVYGGSDLDNGAEVLKELKDDTKDFIEELKDDKIFALYSNLLGWHGPAVGSKIAPLQSRINALQREYMQAQMEVFKEKNFYPDANSTMRVTYGQVKGYEARDAVEYDHYTYLDGVMEKYKPGDYEFDVPQKLRQLYAAKDYGQYGANGKMTVCFIGTNHTTGGNSGSPALDAYGNLVGLNFDRVWEGTMSDLNYDPSICRNIMVDIRYVLFIIDKYAGATNLIQEMKLVRPKKA